MRAYKNIRISSFTSYLLQYWTHVTYAICIQQQNIFFSRFFLLQNARTHAHYKLFSIETLYATIFQTEKIFSMMIAISLSRQQTMSQCHFYAHRQQIRCKPFPTKKNGCSNTKCCMCFMSVFVYSQSMSLSIFLSPFNTTAIIKFDKRRTKHVQFFMHVFSLMREHVKRRKKCEWEFFFNLLQFSLSWWLLQRAEDNFT